MTARTEYLMTLSELRAVHGRIERRLLQSEDYVLFDHFVSNMINREETKIIKLATKIAEDRAKAQAEAAAAPVNMDGWTIDADYHPLDNTGAASDGTAPQPGSGPDPKAPPNDAPGRDNDTPTSDKGGDGKAGKKGKGNPIGSGHGRNGASAFTNAMKIFHTLVVGIIGSLCTKCGGARMTRYRNQVHIRIVGQPFFGAECHHAEQARCKSCGRVISALPKQVTQGFGKSATWDPSAAAMLIVLHYFYGMPFKRIEILHKGWGTPISDATQWEISAEAITNVMPLFIRMIEWAIQNMLSFSFDDTGGMILTLKRQIADELKAAKAMGLPEDSVRTGINASGFHIVTPKGIIILYFTGRHHAAEIMRKLLQHRLPGSPTVNKVTDGAAKNFIDTEFKDIEEGVCNVHAFLKWYDHKTEFPSSYAIVGEAYHEIYTNEATAIANNMTPEGRLAFHQKNSRPWMEKIKALCENLVLSHLVEPRTSLYKAVHFFLNQWPRLTKFLEVAGMPLDTNLCEQSLIAVVRYLTGSRNYHTERGAEVGDAGMSLVATSRANDAEPWTWLTDCLENRADLAKNPDKYLPWNFKERLKTKQDPPAKPPDSDLVQ